MLSSISQNPSTELAGVAQQTISQPPATKMLEEEKAFQQFAAGTFYQTMMKALRSTQKETKYFNGGRAEKIFRAEFDQHVAGALAEENGDQIAGPLFDQFASRARFNMQQKAQQATQQSRQATATDQSPAAIASHSPAQG